MYDIILIDNTGGWKAMHSVIRTYPGLLEKEIWINADGKRIFIRNMDEDYRTKVIKLLEREKTSWSGAVEINEILDGKLWELRNL
jgi:hypothetical protein